MTDRGLSVVVNYVLGLAVTTLLMTGLLYAAGDVVDNRGQATTLAELRVVGEQVAADLMAADRLAQSGAQTVAVGGNGPDSVAGRPYTVALNATTQEVVVETSLDPTVTARIPFRNRTPVRSSTAQGGHVEIVLTGTGELKVIST